jgi:hypothetical protein
MGLADWAALSAAAARVGAGGIEVVDAEIESSCQKGLRGVFVLDGTKACAGPEADTGDHFTGLAKAAFRQCARRLRGSRFGGAEHNGGGGGF